MQMHLATLFMCSYGNFFINFTKDTMKQFPSSRELMKPFAHFENSQLSEWCAILFFDTSYFIFVNTYIFAPCMFIDLKKKIFSIYQQHNYVNLLFRHRTL